MEIGGDQPPVNLLSESSEPEVVCLRVRAELPRGSEPLIETV